MRLKTLNFGLTTDLVKITETETVLSTFLTENL